MEQLLSHLQEIFMIPDQLLSLCPFIPDFIKDAILTSIKFIPWLYFLYYAVELLERFLLKNTSLLVKLYKYFGRFFGSIISVVPGCSYSVIASSFYSRKMISRGTLLAFFVACSDDALPLLLMDTKSAMTIIPIMIIKIIVGIAVSFIVDLSMIFEKKVIQDIKAINIELNQPGCCHHMIISGEKEAPYWWMHPLNHTFNMFMFTLLSLCFINAAIAIFGSAENLASILFINSPLQVIATAAMGMCSNCIISVILALLYIKGLISFPAFVAGLVTATGLGLATLKQSSQNKVDTKIITILLFITGIVTGFILFMFT